MAPLIRSPYYYARRAAGDTHDEAVAEVNDWAEDSVLTGPDDEVGNVVTRTVDPAIAYATDADDAPDPGDVPGVPDLPDQRVLVLVAGVLGLGLLVQLFAPAINALGGGS